MAAKSTPCPGTTFMPDSRSAKVLSPRARAAVDGLLLGQAGGQLPADHAVEQQVGRVSEDPRPDDADRDSADAKQDDRRGQRPLGSQLLDQADRRALEVARTFGRRLH